MTEREKRNAMELNIESFLSVEKNNSRRIERLEEDVSEIRKDLAALPGTVVTELEKRNPREQQQQHLAWAFGVLLTVIGAVAWNFYISDQNALRRIELNSTLHSQLQKVAVQAEESENKQKLLTTLSMSEIENLRREISLHVERLDELITSNNNMYKERHAEQQEVIKKYENLLILKDRLKKSVPGH